MVNIMKRLSLSCVLVFFAVSVSAAEITCDAVDLTPRQTTLLAGFLTTVNEDRVEAEKAPYATFGEYCSATMFSAVISYIKSQAEADAAKVAAAAEANGNDTAPNAHCSAASLAPGCKKNEVACFVLTGNTSCE